MAALFVLFAASVLAATAVHHVAGHQAVFLSIDCGLDAAFSPRTNTRTDIVYVSDGAYVDGGENRRVQQESGAAIDTSLLTLRSFPSGLRNCYALPTESGEKYLVRMEFLYGNYDGKNSSSLEFDLHLGTNYWDTYQYAGPAGYSWSEAIFVAWASWAPVCLVNTGGGTPFVNTVELRPLADALYADATANQSMSTHDRGNMGEAASITRFPDDPNDRFWVSRTSSIWQNLSTRDIVNTKDNYEVPNAVLQTAIVPINNGTTVLNLAITGPSKTSLQFMVFLHFVDFQNSKLRQFDVHIVDEPFFQYSPKYLTVSHVKNSAWSSTTDDKYNVTLVATNISMLPPIINAYEVYTLIHHDTPRTFSNDFDAMMAIKLQYGVKKNWMGDPCFPAKYAWNGVKCGSTTDNTTRIISLDLSNTDLHGVISDNFTLLTELQSLDLSGNSLSGPIPDSLCKRNNGTLVFRYESNKYDMCNKKMSSNPPKNRTTIISISVAVLMVVVVVLVLSYLISRKKRKSKMDPPRVPESHNAIVSIKSNGGQLQNADSRRFTYTELEKFTNKFERSIGQGGFGFVYYGRLEDNTEVAVKMRSESSLHGLDEFLAEVNSLTKVHHRNLVSLVGYCWEQDHLALVYEYMSQGNLCDHLRGKNGAHETLSWGTRVRIVLESAQGLDYLHKGCSLPIIHRDVKTNNILLGHNLQAKIADFGLCKTYLSDKQTHISTNAAGSTGYMDPEYYHTGWLTESSDVYSFGVVLLEVATGEPPILAGHGHIIQRVKQKIASGDISKVADAQLRGSYDVNSMWKLVDTAMACISDSAVGRPTMAVVVGQLKESLALQQPNEENSIQGSFVSTTGPLGSTFGPSAR
ncbi:unnamed protein product [Alopecurus aequalis]